MSDDSGQYQCLHCGKNDYPVGMRRGSEHECRCGGSIYDGEERFNEPRSFHERILDGARLIGPEVRITVA